jgi:hypothetical protein
MRKVLAVALFLGACMGQQAVTMNSFSDVLVGSTENEVVSTIGEPYRTKTLADGSVEYEYIEKFNQGGRILEERHYFIVMKEGKVASKRIEYQSPPPYTFDSYEMQTTQNTPNAE